jgi:hypothetical protein
MKTSIEDEFRLGGETGVARPSEMLVAAPPVHIAPEGLSLALTIGRLDAARWLKLGLGILADG